MTKRRIPRLGIFANPAEQAPVLSGEPDATQAAIVAAPPVEVTVIPEAKEFDEVAQHIVGSMMEYIAAGGGDLAAETFVQADGFTEEASRDREEFLALLSQATGVDVGLRLQNSEYGNDGVAKSGVVVEPWLKQHLDLTEANGWGKPDEAGWVEGGIQRQAILGTNDYNMTFL